MVTDVAPLVDQMLRTQRTLLSVTDGVDFRNNTFGGLIALLCGPSPDSNSTKSTQARSSSWPMNERKDSSSQQPTQRNASEFCQTLIGTLEGSPRLRPLWSTFRPIIQGKVLYTPDTQATRQLMAQANGTFDALARLKALGEAWAENEPRIWDFFQNGSQINRLRDLLKDPIFAAIIDQRLNGTGLTAAIITNFLYNGPPEDRPVGMPDYDWRNAFNTTSQILGQMTLFLGCLDLDKFEAIAGEGPMVDRALELIDQQSYWAGIVFEGLVPNATQLPAFVKYKIRMDIEDVERSDKIKDRSWDPGARDHSFKDMRYVWGGFAYLQDMIDQGIVQTHTGKSQPLGVFAQQMPYPCYVDDAFLRSLARSLPLYLTLAWIYSVAMFVKAMVQEKEARLKETVRMMGLQGVTYCLSWFISILVPLSVSALLLTLILKYGNVLRYSDPSVIFVFLLVFCLATIMQSFLISVFFSRANLAAACGGLIYFVLYLPHSLCYAWSEQMTFPMRIGASLLSCVAFGFGCEKFTKYEEQGIGIQWHNVARSPEGDRYSFIVSIAMMLADALIYWVLTWYIENIYPGQYGIAKPFYFPFTRSYWFGSASTSELGTESEDPEDHKGYLEKPPPNIRAGVSVRNLVKIYKTGKKLAVDGLSLDFYENQITSFLGHNGAGKTTTMSILTGLFAPTSGTAIINGYDIRTDMDSIRKHMGMCPQHNVLFDDLTVEEHIYFYARLKGRSKKEVDIEIDQMIQDVGLPHKRKELAKNLSGGMQRKLSVAIAFVGGSNIVILDEPTAGVDPYARRGIWELLLKYKQGRTIILSTHHMDEADILGDRIAIISHGRMCCCGSSLFLKKCFGSGYYLTLVRTTENKMASQRPAIHQNSNHSQSDSVDDGIGSQNSSCSDPPDVADVSSLIRKHVPQAVFLEGIGQELTYILPYAGARDGTFALLFKELDLEMGQLGISSYGIADTSLEEIFLKVAEDTGVDMEPQDKAESFTRDWKRSSRDSRRNSIAAVKTSTNPAGPQLIELKGRSTNKVVDWERASSLNGKGSSVISGWRLIRRQFLALFIKRFHHARRSRKGLLAQIVMPALFVCLALIFSLIVPPFREYPKLELQPWMYGAKQNTFISVDEPNVTEVSQVAKSLLNDPGFGTRCMAGNPIPHLPCEPQKATDWYTPPVDSAVSDIFANGNWSFANPSPDCECSTPQRTFMLPDCPLGAGGLPPPQKTQITTDMLHDMTGRNMTDYLLKSYEKSGKNRYGGISVGGENSQVRMNESEIATVFEDLRNLFNASQVWD
ncbi:hypothetical protein AALO_G00302200 [Alosa alosa]|uniref:ABC transporter domain-containing protein n=1 Tax=Alosa alosa TaxID=278164 RepID=A0AAV6FHY0_9TELE|nr:hypothetical protein AALO_G00302200 [Alosa alosa]